MLLSLCLYKLIVLLVHYEPFERRMQHFPMETLRWRPYVVQQRGDVLVKQDVLAGTESDHRRDQLLRYCEVRPGEEFDALAGSHRRDHSKRRTLEVLNFIVVSTQYANYCVEDYNMTDITSTKNGLTGGCSFIR